MEIRTFPNDAEMTTLYDKIPHDALEYMAYHGLFRQEFPFEDRTAQLLVFLPERLRHDCNNVLVLVPDGRDAADFLEMSGWLDLADREKLAVFGLSSLSGWEENKEESLRLAQRVRDLVVERKYYNVGKSRRYVAAYGNAAATGERLILTSPSCLSGLALVGEGGCAADELEKLGEAPSTVPYIPIKDVACPVSLFTRTLSGANKAAVDFFVRCNRLDPKPYARDGMTFYLPDGISDDNWVQSENIAPVAILEDGGLDDGDKALTVKAWGELKKYYRALDYINVSTHANRTEQQCGTTRRDCVIDTYSRFWLEYEPAAAKRGEGKRPLVVVLHGGSGNPDMELTMSEWTRTAQVRDLYLAIPHGSLRRFENASMPHPAWNASGKSADQDDFKFIRHIVEDMCQRYPIDRTRVYITGHSMGSAMTQQMILHSPELFAAAASNSGVIRGGFFGGIQAAEGKDGYRMPVIIQMGENDVGGGTFEANPDAKNTIAYWIGRNEAGDVDHPLEYVNGPFRHKVFENADGVPVVHYITTDHKPHAVTAQDSLLYYDEFLCKFSRLADGTICYMGRPIR